MTNDQKIQQVELNSEIYKALMESLAESAIFSVTDEKGNIIYANRKFLEISQYTVDEILGQNHRMLKSGEHSTEFYENLWRTISSGKVWRGEIKNRAKDGSYYWVDATIVPVLGENGVPKNYVALRVLITERKAAEEKLRQGEEIFDTAQKVAKIGNWTLDSATNKLSWSKEIYRIFEIDPEKITVSYDDFLAAVHPDERSIVDAAYSESVKNKTPYNIEHRLLMNDGRIKYVVERGETSYSADGKPLRSIGTVHDITERKEIEEKDKRHLSDLEKMNRFVVDRELKMVELKKEIKTLEAELIKARGSQERA